MSHFEHHHHHLHHCQPGLPADLAPAFPPAAGADGVQGGASVEALRLLDKKQAASLNTSDGWMPAALIDSDGKKVYAHWAAEALDAHQYTVKEGEDLFTVARRSLGVTGHPDATKQEIQGEMKRIAELNADSEPGLLRHHGSIGNGTTLRLSAPEAEVRQLAPSPARQNYLPDMVLA